MKIECTSAEIFFHLSRSRHSTSFFGCFGVLYCHLLFWIWFLFFVLCYTLCNKLG